MMPIDDRPHRHHYLGAQAESPHKRSATPLLPRRFDLTCADCGTTWSVSPSDILAGDAWVTCPVCANADRKQEER
ncbi:hypothetical protein [Sphaerobacter sp.]|uniref:hypothetical protein n=1 Tax=Sphaerobacter sp. TaxID=2099654 RepID=UPI001D6F72B5|nr:hypothetical protein [Sphaerobacter sp.]MBX5446848.1 hypothetical protein [Sphaerobacter sp.]